MTGSVVRMSVPAEGQYVRAVRLVAASLAADHGFDVDYLEDIRVAVDELCALLQPADAPTVRGTIDLEFSVSASELEVRGSYHGSGRTRTADWLVEEILAATSDQVELPSDTEPEFRYLSRRAR